MPDPFADPAHPATLKRERDKKDKKEKKAKRPRDGLPELKATWTEAEQNDEALPECVRQLRSQSLIEQLRSQGTPSPPPPAVTEAPPPLTEAQKKAERKRKRKEARASAVLAGLGFKTAATSNTTAAAAAPPPPAAAAGDGKPLAEVACIDCVEGLAVWTVRGVRGKLKKSTNGESKWLLAASGSDDSPVSDADLVRPFLPKEGMLVAWRVKPPRVDEAAATDSEAAKGEEKTPATNDIPQQNATGTAAVSAVAAVAVAANTASSDPTLNDAASVPKGDSETAASTNPPLSTIDPSVAAAADTPIAATDAPKKAGTTPSQPATKVPPPPGKVPAPAAAPLLLGAPPGAAGLICPPPNSKPPAGAPSASKTPPAASTTSSTPAVPESAPAANRRQPFRRGFVLSANDASADAGPPTFQICVDGGGEETVRCDALQLLVVARDGRCGRLLQPEASDSSLFAGKFSVALDAGGQAVFAAQELWPQFEEAEA